MYLPDYFHGSSLCGVAFDEEGILHGQYFKRNYNHAEHAAPEYCYGKATEKAEDFKLSSYGPYIDKEKNIKARITKKPAIYCNHVANHKSIDKCDD